MRISDWSSDVCSSDLEEHQYQGNELQTDEWDDTPVDVKRGDLRRRHAAQVEQRPAERRSQERALQVDGDQDRHPGQVDVVGLQDRQEQRHHDVADLDPLDEEAEDEDQDHHEDDDAGGRSEEHTSELQSLMRTSYAV